MEPRLMLQVGMICIAIMVGCGGKDHQAGTNFSVANVIAKDLEEVVQEGHSIQPKHENLPLTRYLSDKDHSSISFQTGHWEIVDLIGWFEDFQVVMYSDSADFSDAVVYAEADPASIRMPNMKMAQTASKAPYIDSENYPVVSFESRRITLESAGKYTLDGVFNMNGVDKLITFEVLFKGYAYPGEKSICGFKALGKINRHDFNIAGDDRLHSGKAVHGDTIEIRMDLRME
ncbi:MAG: YceI family protein [Saprospiraceae bacterium]|nr:YceI family protein [Saprospiraceae bacterium]